MPGYGSFGIKLSEPAAIRTLTSPRIPGSPRGPASPRGASVPNTKDIKLAMHMKMPPTKDQAKK